MTQDEAILEIESKFIVHHEIGEPLISLDTDGKQHETGARNWSRAPCGEPYVSVWSSGVKAQGEPLPMMFGSESRAFRWWYYSVLDYAETIAPEEEFSKLHLYWRDKPQFELNEYVSLNQAQQLQSGLSLLPVKLGSVYSRLLITRLRPDGTEGP